MSGNWVYPEKGIIPLPYHHTMLSDRNRCIPFAEAISRVVQPGNVVFEPGAGTGLLSFFAARTARKVYAVELDPGVAETGRALIKLNGVEDRVLYQQGRAEDHIPPEPVDVVICEMMHVGLVNEQQVPVLNLVRERLESAYPAHPYRVIPQAAVNYCQLMEADYNYYGYLAPFPRLGPAYIKDRTMAGLSTLVPYWSVDFGAHVDPSVKTTVRLTVTEPGTINAVRLSTQAVLDFDETRPQAEQLIDWYLNYLLLPLPQRFQAQPGDAFDVSLQYEAGCAIEAMRIDVIPA